MSQPTPILIYGTARSGTTALTNHILSHAKVAGLAHPLHWGAHEIPLHGYARYWGDIGRPGNLERFLGDLEGSDLWRLADEDTAWWSEHPPTDMYEWFLTLMDRVAIRTGSAYWVVKLDPAVVNRRTEWRRLRRLLEERYDRYHVVGVRRPRADVLESYVRMPGPTFRARQGALAGVAARLLGLARYRIHGRDLERLAEREGAIVVDFADLVGDTEAVARALRAEIGELGRVTESPFPRNTSFTAGTRRGGRSRADRAGASARERGRWAGGPMWRLACGAFDRLPALATVLVRGWEWRRPSSNPLYYRLRRAEENPEELAGEFRRTGHEALIPHIFDSRER